MFNPKRGATSDWPADANNSDYRTSEPGATTERTNKENRSDCRADEQASEKNEPYKSDAYPFDNSSVRRKKRFCMNSDNINLRFYYTFFDEMGINNFLKRPLAFSLKILEDARLSTFLLDTMLFLTSSSVDRRRFVLVTDSFMTQFFC